MQPSPQHPKKEREQWGPLSLINYSSVVVREGCKEVALKPRPENSKTLAMSRIENSILGEGNSMLEVLLEGAR